ncbi:MAG: transporter substrate-binding domain-containing protein [Candidatus Delongbacteria bacterium]|nr:transporter substrate-binding domain-containing protein [Candidatus Delongbacteria bacterium]MBN2834583.1 transporter substrate-binding domain-containing protein [Candidatus Delongbacteria bacterium]
MKIILIILVFYSLLFSKSIKVYTEEFPPYNYETSDGEVTGVSTEIVKAIFEDAEILYGIFIYPWARAIYEVENNEYTALYSTSRRPDREAKFLWVGELLIPKYSIFALSNRDDIKGKKIEDFKQYRIGTTKGDARESYLISKGFKIGENIDQVTGAVANIQNYKKLKMGRIDLWPMPDAVSSYIMEYCGDKSTTLKKVFTIEELSQNGYYLALNKNTPKEIVDKLQNSLIKLKRNGTINRIYKKWGV